MAWFLPALIALAANEVGLELPWHEYSPEMEGFIEKISERLTPEQIEQMKTGMEAVPILMITGGNDLTAGLTGLTGFIVLSVVNVMLWIYERFLAEEPLTVNIGQD